MDKTLIDVDQSKEKTWFILPSNVECTIAFDGIKAWALELHHGFTMQGQPWCLGMA
jgi:hypothetical protein